MVLPPTPFLKSGKRKIRKQVSKFIMTEGDVRGGNPHSGRRVRRASMGSNRNGSGYDGRRHEGLKQAKEWGLCPQRGHEGPSTLVCGSSGLAPPPAACAHPGASGKEPTAVRTDDDSGFDTLWLLKKMDSRSETAKTGRGQS